ncbi:hypothetical protein [Nocardia caishijiensis]|uniref:Uncharacterized protein n=1 Tax=Nocardia caishijiensis TaxID=184756 RepID=A0ABQ6YSD3_9NOCA|nr:hypothetical protein [Nocardia caishijiensis]KAF0848381.1 hypothetical protein FNL39_102529 [Nocardia caishijiensis]
MANSADRQPTAPEAKAQAPTHRPQVGGFLLGKLLLTQALPRPRPA